MPASTKNKRTKQATNSVFEFSSRNERPNNRMCHAILNSLPLPSLVSASIAPLMTLEFFLTTFVIFRTFHIYRYDVFFTMINQDLIKLFIVTLIIVIILSEKTEMINLTTWVICVQYSCKETVIVIPCTHRKLLVIISTIH